MDENYRYSMNIHWSDEDEGFIVVVPELPGCSAWGETRETAITEAYGAIFSWLEAAKAMGRPAPEPRVNLAP